MPVIPKPRNTVARQIYRFYERVQEDWRRDHLGASQIGDQNCLRQLWYSFRWAIAPKFEGRILRLFETGKREEERVIENLRRAGMTVADLDPRTKEQWRIAFLGGHIGGGTDGMILGVPQAPKTWHILEIKTANEKRFKRVQKEGLAKGEPGHHAQIQIYMRGFNLARGLYICVWKDTDRIYEERIYIDQDYADAMIGKAMQVVHTRIPPARISDDPSWFECKFCTFRDVCHMGIETDLERNCRTCTSSEALPNGSWECIHHNDRIGKKKLRDGCEDHLFIPQVVPAEPIDGEDTKDRRYVRYRHPSGREFVDEGRKFIDIEEPA